MAFLEIRNLAIRGIGACVPKIERSVRDLGLFNDEEAERFSGSTGVFKLRIADNDTTTADLVFHSAAQLIEDLGWQKEEIDVLVFVSQTPDYILPATSCILQDRLGLREDTLVFDISLGCSGWVYGLLTISNLISNGTFKKGLLLVGDTISKICSKEDKSTFPLFGDAGTATALEFHEGMDTLKFHWGVDGSGSKAIIIPDGGFRNPFSQESFKSNEFDQGIIRAPKDLVLEGMDVFSFGISKAPESVNKLTDFFKIDRENVDYFIFHQANKFMNEKIRKKLKIPEEKVPYSLQDFGNTSSATIPLTMVTQLNKKLVDADKTILACGFGVGLSWGTVVFNAKNIHLSSLIEI